MSKKKSEKQQEETEHTKITRDPERSVAEWTSLIISLVVLVVLIGLLLYAFLKDGNAPPVIEVEPHPEQAYLEAGGFYLPVDVKNAGSQTAQEVNIQVTLTVEDEPAETIAFNLPFLVGGESVQGTVIFQQDPAQGELAIAVSFISP